MRELAAVKAAYQVGIQRMNSVDSFVSKMEKKAFFWQENSHIF